MATPAAFYLSYRRGLGVHSRLLSGPSGAVTAVSGRTSLPARRQLRSQLTALFTFIWWAGSTETANWRLLWSLGGVRRLAEGPGEGQEGVPG